MNEETLEEFRDVNKAFDTTFLDRNLNVLEEDDFRACIKIRKNINSGDEIREIKMSSLGLFNPEEQGNKGFYKNRDWRWQKVNDQNYDNYVHFLNTNSGSVFRILERKIKDGEN